MHNVKNYMQNELTEKRSVMKFDKSWEFSWNCLSVKKKTLNYTSYLERLWVTIL